MYLWANEEVMKVIKKSECDKDVKRRRPY